MSAWHLQMVTVHGVVVVVVKYVEFSLYVPPHAAEEAGMQNEQWTKHKRLEI